jgi:phosphatidylserine/phosphatidylglycerophosphate/cardiolipin synthase-like enzyme
MKSLMDENVKLYKQRLTYRANSAPNQCLSQPWFVRLQEQVYYPRYGCSIEPLIGGEEVFANIAADMEHAVDSVDIITWGFDPGMMITRGATAETGVRYGDLLIKIATRKINPVKVRLLIWHDDLAAQMLMNNAPGYYGPRLPAIGANGETGYYSEQHQSYSAEWYRKVIGQEYENIHLHVRSVPYALLENSMKGEFAPKDMGVTGKAAAAYAAHHQKMVLIDFERPTVALGYVMGHNSMTEYWDTAHHLFQDIRRERVYDMEHAKLLKLAWREGPSFDGAGPGYMPPEYLVKQKERAVQAFIDRHSRIVKPYQDVSCRVRGPILHDLNHNFCQGWTESRRPSAALLDALWCIPFRIPQMERKAVQFVGDRFHNEMDTGFIARRNKISIKEFPRQKTEHAVQLLRTQPLHSEKAAKECYANLTRQMAHYIFIQNQYLQYGVWAEHLRTCVFNLREAGYARPIYVFLVTSTPERDGMDRPTHELAGRVGESESMPVIHKEAVDVAQKHGTVPPIGAEEMALSGINLLMSSLWTAKKCGMLRAEDYEEIYIHAKVAIVDDAAFTIGSTNLNLRSMALDSELNVLSNASDVAFKLRCDLFKQCAGFSGAETFGDMGPTFLKWKAIQQDNKYRKSRGANIKHSLLPFYVDRQPSKSLI